MMKCYMLYNVTIIAHAFIGHLLPSTPPDIFEFLFSHSCLLHGKDTNLRLVCVWDETKGRVKASLISERRAIVMQK